MKVYSSRISNLNIKYETNGWRPLPHTDPGPVDKWTKCLQEFSDLDPGLVLGPLSQMTINYHQQVSSEDWPNIHHRTSVPVFPGSWEEAAKTWSGSHHQDASWRAGQITDDDDQAMIVSVVLPPDWLMPQTFHQAEAKHWAWERGRVTPVNRCQAASDQTCVTLIPRLVHRKLSSPVSGMSKLSLHDLWDLQCTELNVYLQG